MALRFHARRKIPQRFFPPSQIHPARCRAKAALLNSSSTPSKELTSHVITIVSRAPTQARQNVNSKFLRSNSSRKLRKFPEQPSYFDSGSFSTDLNRALCKQQKPKITERPLPPCPLIHWRDEVTEEENCVLLIEYFTVREQQQIGWFRVFDLSRSGQYFSLLRPLDLYYRQLVILKTEEPFSPYPCL